MSESQIKTGDVAQLKSGGPEMTVGEEVASGIYQCYWFGEGASSCDLHGEAFPAATLCRVDVKTGT